jgi:hypothetical protein
MARVGFTIIRINRRRALRAARRMAQAGWPEMRIRLALGLSKARCRAAMAGQGLWTAEERRVLLMQLVKG